MPGKCVIYHRVTQLMRPFLQSCDHTLL